MKFNTEFTAPSSANVCTATSVTSKINGSVVGGWSLNDSAKTIILIYHTETINGLKRSVSDNWELKVDSQVGNTALNMSNPINSSEIYFMK